MTKKKDEVGSSGRYGPRYGTRVRRKVSDIEETSKGIHRCPECKAKKVERVGSGIWKCGRCGLKFTAKAYVPETTPIKKKIKAESEEVEGE